MQISQLVCTGTQSAITASNLLEDIREKEASHFTAHALHDGITKAFSFAGSNLSSDAFSTAFKIIAGTGNDAEARAVRQLSKRLFSRFEHLASDDGLEGSVQYYLASVVSRLPFVTMDGALTAISCCRELMTSLMENSHKTLQDVCFAKLEERAKYSDGQIMLLQAECRTATLLAQLSIFLAKKYKIKSDRIKKFCADTSVLDRSQISKENDDDCLSDEIFSPLSLFAISWLPTRDVKFLEADLDKCLALVHGMVAAETAPVCAAEDMQEMDNMGPTKSTSKSIAVPRRMGKRLAARSTGSDLKSAVGTKGPKSETATKPRDRSRLRRKASTSRKLNDSSTDEDLNDP